MSTLVYEDPNIALLAESVLEAKSVGYLILSLHNIDSTVSTFSVTKDELTRLITGLQNLKEEL